MRKNVRITPIDTGQRGPAPSNELDDGFSSHGSWITAPDVWGAEDLPWSLGDADSDADEEVKDAGAAMAAAAAAKCEALEGQLRALMERVRGLKARNKQLTDHGKAVEAERNKLQGQLDELQQDSELMLSQLQGQSEKLRMRPGRPGAAHESADESRQRGDDFRRALLSDVAVDDDDEGLQRKQTKSRVHALIRRINHFIDRRLPLMDDIRFVQARYGVSVSAYFSFYHWLIITYLWLGMVCVLVSAYHMVLLHRRGSPWHTMIDSVGSLPKFMIFSSFTSDEGVLYAGMVLCFIGLLLWLAIAKWVKEDRVAKAMDVSEEESKNLKFAKSLLCAWDNSLTSASDVQNNQFVLGQSITLMLEERKVHSLTQLRTKREVLIIYARRLLGFMVYMSLQMAGWTAIVILTANSAALDAAVTSSMQKRSAALGSVASAVGSSLVPTVVSVINAAMPVLIQYITRFERWDSANMTIKQLVFRMYSAKMLNVLIQVLSYTVLADPYLLSTSSYYTFRPSITKPPDLKYYQGTYNCRADQVGVGLFQVVVTEFVVSKVIALGAVLVKKVVAHYRKRPFQKAEFDIAAKTVSLLYFHAVILAALPWVPLSTIFVIIFFQLSFKYDKAFLTHFETKPARPWKAQDAGGFFIKFYLATLLMIGFGSVYYFFNSTHFPKDCTLQDHDVGLCASAVDAATGACTMNANSPYHEWFTSDNGKREFGGKPCGSYPACLCAGAMACGPFVGHTSAYHAISEAIGGVQILGIVYTRLAGNVSIWVALCVVLLLVSYFRRNTMMVREGHMAQRVRDYEACVHTLQLKVKRQDKSIKKLELSSGISALSPRSAGV